MRQRLPLGSLSDAAMRPAEVIDVDQMVSAVTRRSTRPGRIGLDKSNGDYLRHG